MPCANFPLDLRLPCSVGPAGQKRVSASNTYHTHRQHRDFLPPQPVADPVRGYSLSFSPFRNRAKDTCPGTGLEVIVLVRNGGRVFWKGVPVMQSSPGW